jgi:hypothetical protein
MIHECFVSSLVLHTRLTADGARWPRSAARFFSTISSITHSRYTLESGVGQSFGLSARLNMPMQMTWTSFAGLAF